MGEGSGRGFVGNKRFFTCGTSKQKKNRYDFPGVDHEGHQTFRLIKIMLSYV